MHAILILACLILEGPWICWKDDEMIEKCNEFRFLFCASWICFKYRAGKAFWNYKLSNLKILSSTLFVFYRWTPCKLSAIHTHTICLQSEDFIRLLHIWVKVLCICAETLNQSVRCLYVHASVPGENQRLCTLSKGERTTESTYETFREMLEIGLDRCWFRANGCLVVHRCYLCPLIVSSSFLLVHDCTFVNCIYRVMTHFVSP